MTNAFSEVAPYRGRFAGARPTVFFGDQWDLQELALSPHGPLVATGGATAAPPMLPCPFVSLAKICTIRAIFYAIRRRDVTRASWSGY